MEDQRNSPVYSVNRGDTICLFIGTDGDPEHGDKDEMDSRFSSEEDSIPYIDQTMDSGSELDDRPKVDAEIRENDRILSPGDGPRATSAEDAIRTLLGQPPDGTTSDTETGQSRTGAGYFRVRASHRLPSDIMESNGSTAKKAPIRKSLDDALKKIADSRQRLSKLVNLKPNKDAVDRKAESVIGTKITEKDDVVIIDTVPANADLEAKENAPNVSGEERKPRRTRPVDTGATDHTDKASTRPKPKVPNTLPPPRSGPEDEASAKVYVTASGGVRQENGSLPLDYGDSASVGPDRQQPVASKDQVSSSPLKVKETISVSNTSATSTSHHTSTSSTTVTVTPSLTSEIKETSEKSRGNSSENKVEDKDRNFVATAEPVPEPEDKLPRDTTGTSSSKEPSRSSSPESFHSTGSRSPSGSPSPGGPSPAPDSPSESPPDLPLSSPPPITPQDTPQKDRVESEKVEEDKTKSELEVKVDKDKVKAAGKTEVSTFSFKMSSGKAGSKGSQSSSSKDHETKPTDTKLASKPDIKVRKQNKVEALVERFSNSKVDSFKTVPESTALSSTTATTSAARDTPPKSPPTVDASVEKSVSVEITRRKQDSEDEKASPRADTPSSRPQQSTETPQKQPQPQQSVRPKASNAADPAERAMDEPQLSPRQDWGPGTGPSISHERYKFTSPWKPNPTPRQEPLMDTQDALRTIAMAEASRREHGGDSRFGPLLASGAGPAFTPEQIRAKLRETQHHHGGGGGGVGNVSSALTSEVIRSRLRESQDGGAGQQPHYGPSGVTPSVGSHQISVDETKRRLEMVKRMRQRLASGGECSGAGEGPGAEEEEVNVEERYAKTEEKVFKEIERLKERVIRNELLLIEKSMEQREEGLGPDGGYIPPSPRRRASSVDIPRDPPAGGDGQDAGDAGEGGKSDVTGEHYYGASRNAELAHTAQKLDYFRYKQDQADSMCNAKIDRLLAGVGQRYGEYQSSVLTNYISPSSTNLTTLLYGSGERRSGRGSERELGRVRRTQSTDRVRFRPVAGDDPPPLQPRAHARNPSDTQF